MACIDGMGLVTPRCEFQFQCASDHLQNRSLILEEKPRPSEARKGSIGVYLEEIVTVTPVYTVSVTSQVNGMVVSVSYQEGHLVHKGDLQAQGTLQRDENVLAQASWT